MKRGSRWWATQDGTVTCIMATDLILGMPTQYTNWVGRVVAAAQPTQFFNRNRTLIRGNDYEIQTNW